MAIASRDTTGATERVTTGGAWHPGEVEPTPGEPGGEPAGSTHQHRVAVVDDHALLRAGTRQILDDSGDLVVVGEAASSAEAIELATRLSPDVMIVDIRLPDRTGIELARDLRKLRPSMKVILLSAYDDEDYVLAGLDAGVAGYLLKTTPAYELVRAVRAVCSGMTVLDPAISTGMLRRSRSRISEDPGFTDRELEIIQLAALGLTNKAIASQLCLSPRTVEGHVSRIFYKLHLGSRGELVHWAHTSGKDLLGARGFPVRAPGSD